MDFDNAATQSCVPDLKTMDDLDLCSSLTRQEMRCASEAFCSSSTSNDTEKPSCSSFDVMDVTSAHHHWARVDMHDDQFDPLDADEEDSQDEYSDEQLSSFVQRLRRMLFMQNHGTSQVPSHSQLLPSFDLAGVAQHIRSGRAKRIICMCGAGISVSAGIPDFRSPGTGLYSQLEKYNLPRPEAVFEIDFFRENPKAFFLLAKELFPGQYKPTATHHFMKLLHDKGLLLRCFTQNIDSLETQAGLPKEAVVAAHGNFDSAHCVECKREHDVEYVRQCVNTEQICRCSCGGLVKPDIVFFGESLPQAFFHRRATDLPECDLLIVMGTSLVVHPFAGLIDDVASTVPRLLINREKVGEASWWSPEMGFHFDEQTNYRDALYLGNCDDGVMQLASLLGWEAELRTLMGHPPHDGSSPQSML